jgi:putative nucleotidyltransferase with HDIG domain
MMFLFDANPLTSMEQPYPQDYLQPTQEAPQQREEVDLFELLSESVFIKYPQLIAPLQSLKQQKAEKDAAYKQALVRALTVRDLETHEHTDRVTNLTIKLAHHMGVDEETQKEIRWGALLHDIGKIGVPDAILFKPGPLTEAEWVIMREHPVLAYQLLSNGSIIGPALEIPYLHHEKWDGTGYPLGLKGEDIPLSARVFAIVDVWDALCSKRPYREAWEREQILDHIRKGSGKHFDPKVVEAFLALVNEH